MWCCRWIELQLKEFKSQALNHDRELAEYDHKKQVEFEKLTYEAFLTKSQPFSSQIQRMKVLKRKKRKRVEETTDMLTNKSHHNLFSYYGSKKSSAGNSSVDGDWGNLAYSEFNMEDLFMHQSAVEVTPFVDVTKSISQHQVGVLCENAEEDILTHNQAAQEELCSYGSYINLEEETSSFNGKARNYFPSPYLRRAIVHGAGNYFSRTSSRRELAHKLIHAVYYTKCKGALHVTISPGPASGRNLPTNTSTQSIIQNVRYLPLARQRSPPRKGSEDIKNDGSINWGQRSSAKLEILPVYGTFFGYIRGLVT